MDDLNLSKIKSQNRQNRKAMTISKNDIVYQKEIDENFQQSIFDQNERNFNELESYEDYLEFSKLLDMENFNNRKIIYKSGVDFSGKPVVIIYGNIPEDLNSENLFLYFIKIMDEIVNSFYSIIYIVVSGGNKPSLNWLRKLYQIVPRKYKKNLCNLYILNPTFWIRTAILFFRPFISSKFWKKLQYIYDIKEFNAWFSPDQIKFPPQALSETIFRKNNSLIFGISLDISLNHPMNHGRQIPLVMEMSISCIKSRGLKTEGIFRISGEPQRIKEIEDSFNKGIPISLEDEVNIHNVCAILKKYLRDLPEPTIPTNLNSSLFQIQSTVFENKVEAYVSVISKMNKNNFNLLREVILMANEISYYSNFNKMNGSNLAIVLGPNLIWFENQSPEESFQNIFIINNIINFFIDNPQIFSIQKS